MKKINVEEEIKKLTIEIEKIRESTPKRAPEYIKEAQQASKKTSEFRNRAEDAKKDAETYLQHAIAIAKEIKNADGVCQRRCRDHRYAASNFTS